MCDTGKGERLSNRLDLVLLGYFLASLDSMCYILNTGLVVEGALAGGAGETLLVVQPRLGRHLLRLEHLSRNTSLEICF